MLSLSHKKLDVYVYGVLFLKEVYRTTSFFPGHELYSLTKQIRRAAISGCSNIAEGASRISRKEKKRFYEIARSSLVEIDTQFEIAIALGYYQTNPSEELEKQHLRLFKILSKMIDNLRTENES